MAEDTTQDTTERIESTHIESAAHIESANIESAETAIESAPEAEATGPEPSAVTEAGADSESAAPSKHKRSIKTRGLFAGALALGLIGGVAGGYTIQALRKPTPLPALAVAQPVYPQSPIYDGTQPAALPASQDDATTVNGDLTKLLLPTPAGAQASFFDHQWVELSQDAADCNSPSYCFSSSLRDRIVRIAGTTWTRSDGLFVEIRIYQYLPGYSGPAADDLAAAKGRSNMLSLPDSLPAAAYEFNESSGDNVDFGVAVHGDLLVDFWVTSSSHVPDPSIISDLITRQMARL